MPSLVICEENSTHLCVFQYRTSNKSVSVFLVCDVAKIRYCATNFSFFYIGKSQANLHKLVFTTFYEEAIFYQQ